MNTLPVLGSPGPGDPTEQSVAEPPAYPGTGGAHAPGDTAIRITCRNRRPIKAFPGTQQCGIRTTAGWYGT